MIFSAGGALQFNTDVHAVLRCFSPYTAKPQAHFRELLDAVKLLTLQSEQADWVHQVGGIERQPATSRCSDGINLRWCGVGCPAYCRCLETVCGRWL
jgi:hypothetical protein